MLVSLKAQHNAQNKFRQDINGLRAWAVIAVVLYHFGVPGFSGGFIGVDVFFVISGFLMTKIIVSGIEVGDFSLLRFYLARARRIIPMLLVLCLSLIILGWFWLPESNYKTLATHVLTAILFISNIKFWRESGYFDSSSHEKWLLHTWSLSVEWQFYIILPAFILIAWNLLSYRAMKTSLFIVGFISLFLSYYASYQWPAAAFYLLPTRIWEMLAGGLVWWSTRKNSLSINLSRLTEIIGFIFIVSSIILFDSSMVWPGVYAALPVLGAMLVLSAKRTESLFTSNNLVQRLGASSYSIYLWHWPIVVGLTYLGFQGSYKWVLLGIIVTVLLGELSLKFIENPARKLFSKFSITSNIVYMSFGIIFILIISLVIKYNTFDRGIRSNEETIQLYTEIQSFHVMPKRDNGYCFYDLNSESNPIISESKSVCKIGDNSLKSKGLLFGDSFAGQYDPFIDKIGKKVGFAVDSVSTNWCFPSLTDSFNGPKTRIAYKQCLLNRKYLKENITKYDFIILSGIWSELYEKGYKQDVINVIEYAKSKNVKVYVIDSPTQYDVNVFANFMIAGMNNFPFNLKEIPQNNDVNRKKMAEIFYKMHNDSIITFIPRDDVFNSTDTYSYKGIEVPYSLDGYHISIDGALMAARKFIESGVYKKYFHEKN